MDGKRRWFGWIAVGLGALALAVALLGRGFGPQMAAGQRSANMQQQQGAGQQAGPGANAQPGARQQNAQPQHGYGTNAQPGASGRNTQPGAEQQNAQSQRGPGAGSQGGSAGPGGEERRGGGRPGDAGFGMGGWLHLPFRLIGGSFQWAMLALLIGLGVWMLRGRNTSAASNTVRAEPAQAAPPAPLSPTGEAYIEEPSEGE
jgi:hypothetical protein